MDKERERHEVWILIMWNFLGCEFLDGLIMVLRNGIMMWVDNEECVVIER